MYTVNESIEKIKEDIAEKENQIILLKNYANGTIDFTENNYHKLCETYLRGNRELGEKFEKIFPFLTLADGERFINNYRFFFKVDEKIYKVSISCNATKNISIIIPPPKETYIGQNEIQLNEEKIKIIDEKMKLKTFFSRANYMMQKYEIWVRPIAYLIKYKTKEELY